MPEETDWIIYTDGAARGNPGPAAFAFVIRHAGNLIMEEAGCLGSVTNNQAEYTALVKALERAAELGGKRLTIRSDSELLVHQMNGIYKVKNAQLQSYYAEAKVLAKNFESVAYRHVPRSENSHADRLCNEALDGKRSISSKGEPKKPSRSKQGPDAELSAVHEEGVSMLSSAAENWAHGDPTNPDPAQVWMQLWRLIENSRPD